MKSRQKVILLVMLILFIILAILVKTNTIKTLDNSFTQMVISLRADSITPIFKAITNLANIWFLALVFILVLVGLKNNMHRLFFLLNPLICFGLNYFLKLIIARPRPSVEHLVEETSYSFPSGHAMISLAFYGLLIYIINRTNLDKRVKKISSVMLSLLITLIGFSRIYLGVHYLSDIIGGFLVSGIYLIIYTNILSKVAK